MNNKAKKITMIALAVAINFVGGKLALLLHLPIFLDSIGTMLSAIAIGPLAGAFTALASGLIGGVTGDIFAIYFSASGMLMGVLAGLFLHDKKKNIPTILWKCLLITLPASALSACIETFLFDGITSAAVTTFIIQALSQSALKLLGASFLTQAVTDYIDKLIAIILVTTSMNYLPYEITHFGTQKPLPDEV